MRVSGWLAAALLAGASGAAIADDQARATFGDDSFAAGEEIQLQDAVAGDAFVAGGRARISGRVGGDAVIAGGEVEVRGEVGDDLYAAGGEVRIEATIEGNSRVAGGKVRVARGSELRGAATIAGGRVDVEGNVGRGLQAYGKHIYINGQVGSDLRLAGEEIRIGPDARVGGKLIYRSRSEIDIDPQAQIAGGVEREKAMGRDVRHGVGRVIGKLIKALFFVGVVVLGALFVLALPKFSREAAGIVRERTLASLGLGFAMLIAVPCAAALMFITIIGIPVGLLTLAGYALLLMLGYLVGALFLGDTVLARLGEPRSSSTGWRILFLLLAMIALAIIRRVPAVGDLVVFLFFLAGIGALTIRAWRGYSGGKAAPGTGLA